MKTIRHTSDSLKMYEFLEKYPNQWHSLAKDQRTRKAFNRLQELYGTSIMEFDGFTDQMRFVSEFHNKPQPKKCECFKLHDGGTVLCKDHESQSVSNHTPTPLTYEKQIGRGYDLKVDACQVGIVWTEPFAKQVVRAVNAHEGLVTELTLAYAGLHHAADHEGPFHGCLNDGCVRKKARLAKAEGK